LAKGKSAMDRLKEMSNKELSSLLPCPQHFELIGIYTLAGECQFGEEGPPDSGYCRRCWTQKL